jgi:hypothetical protein
VRAADSAELNVVVAFHAKGRYIQFIL